MSDKLKLGFLLLASLFVSIGLAQDDAAGDDATDAAGQAEVTVMEHDEYGPYLTDAEGNALYLFVNEEAEAGADRVTEGVRENAAPCTDGCLDNWPALQGEVSAGEGLDQELLYTTDVDGRQQVVYNGWPLYYFANDAAPGDTTGQGVGGPPNVWYLVTPEGQPVQGGMGGDVPAETDPEAGAEGDDANGDEGDVGAAGDDGEMDEDVGAEDDGAAGDAQDGTTGAEGDEADGDMGQDGTTGDDGDQTTGDEGDEVNGDRGQQDPDPEDVEPSEDEPGADEADADDAAQDGADTEEEEEPTGAGSGEED